MRKPTHQLVAGSLIASTLAIASAASTPAAASTPVGPNVEQNDVVLAAPFDAGLERFGRSTLVLSNGNYVVGDFRYDDPTSSAVNVGLVVLYDGDTDEPISFVSGSDPGDQIGSGGLYEVGSGDIAIVSPNASVNGVQSAGAVTWMDGDIGFGPAPQIVDTNNSVHGGSASDFVDDITVLSNGDYVVKSTRWNDPNGAADVGAARWVDGDVGGSGLLTAANSIIGVEAGDGVGETVTELGNGNYVVASRDMTWPDDTFPQFTRDNAGGATVAAADGTTVGTFGLGGTLFGYIGGQSNSRIGQTVIPVPNNANGDFVVGSTSMTHVLNGNSASNSGGFRKVDGNVITGANIRLNALNTVWGRGDRLGSAGVEVLDDGSFWLFSPFYFGPPANQSGQRGAVTKVPANQTYPMQVTAANSVVGGPFQGSNSNSFHLGESRAVLDNGNVVVGAPRADTGGFGNNGMFVWLDGSTVPAGEVTDTNLFSPVYGLAANDNVGLQIEALGDDYVVLNRRYDVGTISDAGAIYVGDGSQAITAGTVLDQTNSIVGGSANDFIGNGQILDLSNGNLVVSSPDFATQGPGQGAVLLLDPAQPRVGELSMLDKVTISNGTIARGGLHETADGNVVIQSPEWEPSTATTSQSDFGLVTWMPGDQVSNFEADETNSVAGAAGDALGDVPPWMFADGNYAVISQTYDDPNTADTNDGYAMFVRGGSASTDVPMPGRNAVTGTGDSSFGVLSGFTSTQSFSTGFPVQSYPMTRDRGVVIETGQNRVVLLKLDNLPEFVGQPADVNATTASASDNDTAVTFADPATSDDRDGTANVDCIPASGSSFPVGTTSVTCTATDSNGNAATASVSFDVIVAQGTHSNPPTPDIVPLVPARLADTRSGPDDKTVDGQFEGDGRLTDGQTYKFKVTDRGGVPSDAVAATLNIVAVGPDSLSFMTMYPCDQQRPLASALNSLGADTRANELVAKIDGNGEVCIFTLKASHLVVDVTSYIPAGSALTPLTPARLVDTRSGPDNTTDDGLFEGDGRLDDGEVYEFQVTGRGGVPASGVDSALLNVVAVDTADSGFFTVFPCDAAMPLASGLNYAGMSDVIGNEMVAKVDADGKVCIFTLRDTDLVVDVNAYVADGADIVSITPTRLVETRTGPNDTTIDGRFEGQGRIGSAQTLKFDVVGRGGIPASGVEAVTLNVVAVESAGPGHFTVYPCGTLPLAAALNFRVGQPIANEVVAKVNANGEVCIDAHTETHLVVDATSYVLTAVDN